MPHFDERAIGGLTARIDRTLCVGFGDCIDAAPGAFELDEEGIAVFLDGAGELDADCLIEACRACPVDAITVLDADGTTLAP